MNTHETVPPQLTIFTPAWNRADLLPRLFHSIASQAGPDGAVEWLVIDDGSTDDTPATAAVFATQRPDLVRLLRLENGGKHRAINRAAHEARANWIMLVDSDDAVAEGAIADVLSCIRENNDSDQVGVMRALKRFPGSGNRLNQFHVTHNPCYHWQWVSSQSAFDSAEVIRRSALKKNPFPEHYGERFMAESWLWNRLGRSYLTLFVNRPWVDCWYQPGGLSDSGIKIRALSPFSAMDVYSAIFESPAHWKLRARASINWWRYRFHAKGLHASVRPASRPYAPLGWILYIRDRMRLGAGRTR